MEFFDLAASDDGFDRLDRSKLAGFRLEQFPHFALGHLVACTGPSV